MSQIQNPPAQTTDWESRLTSDLAFIKQNLRYPITRQTLWPAVTAVLLIAGTFFLALFLLLDSMSGSGRNWSRMIGFPVPILAAFIIGWKHYATLKFVSIPTGKPARENGKLLERFLKERQLLVFRHPEAKEVYQIVSKNISMKGEEREVLIFIADDNRILINSHFSSTGFSLLPGTRHHRSMAHMLSQWLRDK